jgi:hypothetical protein
VKSVNGPASSIECSEYLDKLRNPWAFSQGSASLSYINFTDSSIWLQMVNTPVCRLVNSQQFRLAVRYLCRVTSHCATL